MDPWQSLVVETTWWEKIILAFFGIGGYLGSGE
jgi:hypothetical protein